MFRASRLVRSGHPYKFPYPKYVWSPSGGWWPNPRGWERNTAIGFGLMAMAVYPIFMWSEENEVNEAVARQAAGMPAHPYATERGFSFTGSKVNNLPFVYGEGNKRAHAKMLADLEAQKKPDYVRPSKHYDPKKYSHYQPRDPK